MTSHPLSKKGSLSQILTYLTRLSCIAFIGLSRILLADQPLITLSQFATHPALQKTQAGVIQALLDRAIITDKEQIKAANANGQVATSVHIAKHQAALSPTVMIAVATPSAQALLKVKQKETVLAFAAVTDHVAAGLEGENVIGVTDHPPLRELLDLTLHLLPQTKTLGALYHAGEINSVKTIEKLEKLAQKQGLSLKKVTITSSTDIKLALQKLIGHVDVLYLPQDNAVISALPLVVQETLSSKLPVIHNIPLISNDPTLINEGVFLALGCDYQKSGEQLGHMIADILEGKEVSEPIQQAKHQELLINQVSAKILGIPIPEDLLQKKPQS